MFCSFIWNFALENPFDEESNILLTFEDSNFQSSVKELQKTLRTFIVKNSYVDCNLQSLWKRYEHLSLLQQIDVYDIMKHDFNTDVNPYQCYNILYNQLGILKDSLKYYR